MIIRFWKTRYKAETFSLRYPNKRVKKQRHKWHIVGAILNDCAVAHKKEQIKVRFRHISILTQKYVKK